MQILKKFLLASVVTATIFTSLPSYASSTYDIVDGPTSFTDGETWSDPDDAPKLSIKITNAANYRGKTAKLQLKLHGAEWADGRDTTLQIDSVKNISIFDACTYVWSRTEAYVEVDIPDDIDNDDEIEVVVPLTISMNSDADEVSVELTNYKEDCNLYTENELTVAGSRDKRIKYSISDVKTIEGEGELAPIVFSETTSGSLGSRSFKLQMYLTNKDLEFYIPNYIERNEVNGLYRYELDPAKSLEYTGGFEGFKPDTFYFSTTKDHSFIDVRIHGDIPQDNKIGKILFKNLGIRARNNDAEEQKVKVRFDSEDVLKDGEELVVANYKPATKTPEPTKTPEVTPTPTPEPVQQPTNITFTIGQTTYTKNNEQHQMDAAAYIKDPGYTMITIRYVAEAVGVNNIDVNGTQIDFWYEGKHVQLTKGSTIVQVQGEIITLPVPLEVQEGRIYAPVAEIAKIFGFQKEWNAQAKTAHFTK